MEFSRKIKDLRKEKNVSRKELADKTYTTSLTVLKWETGLSLPSRETQRLLCDYFDIHLDELTSIDDSMIIKKNRAIFIYKMLLIFIASLFVLCAIGYVLTNNNKNNTETHIIYDEIPYLKLNNIQTNYYQIGFEYEIIDKEYVLKNNVLTIPNSSELSTITSIPKTKSLRAEFRMSCEYDVQYFYINDSFEPVDNDGSWTYARIYRIENVDEKNNIIHLDEIEFDNNVVLMISCYYQDLNVRYYYVIKK